MSTPSHDTLRAMHALAVDQAAARVYAAVRDAGLDVVLLKGASLAEWLYGAGESARGYGDTDLWVDPDRYAEAERALERSGFEPAEPEEWGESDFQPHARAWVRRADNSIVDLHRALPGLRYTAPEHVWSVMREHRASQRLGGGEVTVLDLPARLVLVVLHLRHHALYEHHWARRRRRRRTCAERWRSPPTRSGARHTACRTGSARHPCSPRGCAWSRRALTLADRLGRCRPSCSSASGPAPTRRCSSASRGWPNCPGSPPKAKVVAREVVPTRAQMRYDSRLARRGGTGLALAYVQRVGHVARYALPSWRAWRRLEYAKR